MHDSMYVCGSRYEREDGVKLTGTLYLPPGYNKDRDGALPCILWAYPREFKSKVNYGGCWCPRRNSKMLLCYKDQLYGWPLIGTHHIDDCNDNIL